MTTRTQRSVLLPRRLTAHHEGSAHRPAARSAGSAPGATAPTGHDHHSTPPTVKWSSSQALPRVRRYLLEHSHQRAHSGLVAEVREAPA